MLHRLSFMTLLWLFPSVPDASGPERLSSIDIVTDEDRRILQRTIAERTVSITVIATGAGSFVTPGPVKRFGAGWILDPEHVMTAAILISEGNHEKSGVTVDWRGTLNQRSPVYLNHKVGLAVVRLESPL